MGEVLFNGNVYGNPESLSLHAMATLGYYTFRYFPKDKIIINADLTVEEYQCKQIYTNMPDGFMDEFVEDEYRYLYSKAYEDIDAGAKKASVTFRMKKNGSMCKISLTPVTYDSAGQLEVVAGIIEDVTDVIEKEREVSQHIASLNEELQVAVEDEQAVNEELTVMLESEREHTAIIKGLSNVFYAIYQLDFVNWTFQELFTKDNIHMVLGEKGRAIDALTGMVEKLVLPETQGVMYAFNEISTMPERIGNEKMISQEFVGLTMGWSRASIIPTAWDENGKPVKALYCTRTIGNEKEMIDSQSNLIRALASTYQDVYVVNMDSCESVAYRMSSVMAIRYVRYFAKGNYEKNIDMYIEKAVLEEDREQFDRARTIASVEKELADCDSFAFTYRELRENKEVYFQCQVIRPSKDRREFIVALKDINNEMQVGIKNAREMDEQLRLIQALSDKYSTLFIVSPEDDRVIPYRLHPKNQRDYGSRIETGMTWDELILDYAGRFTHKDYIEEFKEKLSIANIRKELEGKSSFIYEYKNDRAGEQRFYQIKSVAMQEEAPQRIIIGIADVNEQREEQIAIQNALKDAYEAAKAANHAKTDFLANMSHDIRTPMNAIIGMTAIAATHIDDKERVQDCLKKITVSSKHLLSLINEVLDMSKIESGKIDMAEENFNLSDLIDNLLIMARPQIELHKHKLVVNIKDVEHEKVIGDSLRIQQLFVNLMSNAVKYTPDGGCIKLSITEKPSIQRRLGFYEVVFEDNGIGMSDTFVQNIFEPFSRAKDDRIDKVQGTGLGMVIAKNIVHMMGGNIDIESKLNQGTKITVTFFLKLQDREDVHYESFVDLPILVVDDDEISIESACSMLDDLGMQSEGVLSGREAVARVTERHGRSEDYFAVILDWKMPDMDGIETTKALRKILGEDTLIIIISAYDWSDIEQEARQAGANAFISKPLFKSRLAHLFNVLVGNEDEMQEIVPLQDFQEMDLSGYRLLLAEDNELNAEIACEILEMTGLTVDLASNGAEAVDMIRERGDIKYDLILMDIQMPKMNGYDAARAIRNLGCDYCKSVPIIAMTANAFAEDVQAALSAGMNEHIAKPLDLKVLSSVLQRWILKTKREPDR